MNFNLSKNIIYFSWIISLFATLGSLFFSNILNFPPCVLCWYQRIFMYPLAFILAAGILRKDTKIYLYILPLSIAGLLISFYHNLLYYKIMPDSLAPCTSGISCTTKFIEWLGFITIPFLSFTAFLLITILMLIYRKINKNP